MPSLESLGFGPFFARQLTADDTLHKKPARVVAEQRDRFQLAFASGDAPGVVAGRLRHEGADGTLLPCVGDWVLATHDGTGPARIERVLERRTQFARRAPGRRSDTQVIAANADTVFVVQSLNRDLNPRRLERYLALLWESGARPVVLLSKCDLCPDVDAALAEIAAAAPGVALHVTSAATGSGLETLAPYLGEGQTVAFVGSSGVGKSSLINRLLGQDLLAVREIRDDDRGRHTTTHRQLLSLPGGALLMDTPGMRTLALVDTEDGVGGLFAEIDRLAASCRFADCRHESEPGCAVRAAVEDGTLDEGRFRGRQKLLREEAYEARRTDRGLRLAEQRRWKTLHKAYRARPDKRTLR